MPERTERPIETFTEFGGFKQSDKVTFTYNGNSDEGELKCFKKFLDTGSVMAVICATDKSLFHSDIEVEVGNLQLKFHPGKVENPRFKAGEIK